MFNKRSPRVSTLLFCETRVSCDIFASHVAHQLQLLLLVACISRPSTNKLHVDNANKIKYKNITFYIVVARERTMDIKGLLREKVENFEGREFSREKIVIKRPLAVKDSTIGRHVH